MKPIFIENAQLATTQMNIYRISIMQKYAVGCLRVCVHICTCTEE